MQNPLPIRLPATLAILVVMASLGHAELVEVASRGTPSQTSEWNNGQFPAALAIDGDPSTFSHTDGPTPDNAWLLRLDGSYQIARIEIAMRADCCGGRLTGATVRLVDREGDSVFEEVITDRGPGSIAIYNLPPGVEARSLRIGFENGATNPSGPTHYVHLGEVRVFAEIDLLPAITVFEADPANLSAGQSSLLSWATDGATLVEIVGIGEVTSSGSRSINPAASEVFTLVATNQFGSRSQSLATIVDDALLPPRLTEFMADNANTIVRSDGSTPDWIELWNPNPVPINLAGYRLTDDPEAPAFYTIPSTTLPAGGYLIFDAATRSLDGVPATGFKLSQAADSYLALLSPAGQVLQSFFYPKQREDVSFGLDWDGTAKFFLKPTPGGPALTGTVDGFVADTQFSVDRGFYDAPQSVAITTATPAATIYTTTDGSEPSPENPGASIYSGPLLIDTTTVLRAAAFREGFLPTDVDTQTYLFPDHVPAQSSTPPNFPRAWVSSLNGVQAPVPSLSHYGMDSGVVASMPLRDRADALFSMPDALLSIPTMSLVMNVSDLLDRIDGLHVNARSRGRAWERRASIEYIDPESDQSVQANCGIRMHGGWNRYPEMLKKSFRLYFRSEYGDAKLKLPLFPDSDTDEFDRILLRSGNGKAWPSPWRALSGGGNSLVRNTYLRDQFVRDLQAEMGHDHVAGRFVHLYVNGHYWGLYNPVERVDEHFASSHFGGADEDYDVVKWIRGTGHQMAAGSDQGWNELIALARSGPANQSVYDAMAERLDLPNFIDYMLLNYFAGNIDWVDSNAYAMRDRARGGPFKFYCWDSEETFLSTGTDSTGRNVPDTSTEIHHALRANPEYRVLFGDRAQKHLFHRGALTRGRTEATLMRRAWEIDRAIVGDSARWGNLLRPSNPYDRADWLAEIQNLRSNYLGPRITTTLNQLRSTGLFPGIEVPVFSPQRGGTVTPGFALTLSPPDGRARVYYTTDGSDPRQVGGAVSSTAQRFTSPITVTNDTLVRTRALVGGDWSALDQALFVVGDRANDLYVSEIMYHPAAPLPGETEFLELANRGATTHSLVDLRITGGIRFDFSTSGLSELASGERLVLARNQTAFQQAYPGIELAGTYQGALDNSGDTFSLEQSDGTVLWTLSYHDAPPWPGGTDGGGHSLTYAGGDPGTASSWRPSVSPGGNPGAADSLPFEGGDLLAYAVTATSVRIHPDGAPEFQITTRLGADDAVVHAEWSTDLETWHPNDLLRVQQVPTGVGRAQETWKFIPQTGSRLFFRAVVSLR